MNVVIRSLAIWLLIILAESVHGTLRTLLVEPVIGGHRARQIAVFTGALIFFAITLFSIRWIDVRRTSWLLGIGALWVVLTVAFELVLGRFVMGLSTDRLFSDYDLSSGGLMPIGLLLLFLAPFAAYRLRRSE
jgi:low temperature requirement protein LtrA